MQKTAQMTQINRISLVASLIFWLSVVCCGQNMAPEQDERLQTILDRILIAEQLDWKGFSGLKFHSTQDYIDFYNQLTEDQQIRYASDLDYLREELHLWKHANTPLIKHKRKRLKQLYPYPAAMLAYSGDDFSIDIKPILNLGLGQDSEDTDIYLLNQRGVAVSGGIDGKVYFHTTILESQARFTSNIRAIYQETGFLPGAGFVKAYRSNVYDFTDGVDFLLSRGHVGFNFTKHIGFQFGHGRNFIGNGYRSWLMSDRTTDYLYAKLNWRVGRFQLQNIFAEMVEDKVSPGPYLVLPKKYIAAHYLGFKPFKNMTLGLFEAVVFARDTGFEFNYLNPVIFYRTVEGMIGSPDNVIIGGDGVWNLPFRIQLYGQVVIDEFIFNQLFKNNTQNWTNKWGVQLGIKHIDFFGIKGMDVQYEFNTVRPYTYSHAELKNVYGHYGQPLAHPYGANFAEHLAQFRYQIGRRVLFQGRYINYFKGADVGAESYGGNIFKSYRLRYADDGHSIGQGVRSDVQLLDMELSYELFHNLYVGVQYLWRKEDIIVPNSAGNNINFVAGTIRYNINRFKNDF